MNIFFIVPGIPVPKARARVVHTHHDFGPSIDGFGGKSKAYTPKPTKDYEEKVKALALVARQNAKEKMWASGPVKLEVTFYVKDPTSKPDLSNLVKSIEDACVGIIYQDDAQIVEVYARKEIRGFNDYETHVNFKHGDDD